MHKPVGVDPIPNAAIEKARNAYRLLCADFLREHPDSPYIDYIGAAVVNSAVLDRQARAIELYGPYVSNGMSILDWGCRHAPDSCMLRTMFPDLRIDGADTMDDDFSLFHRYAKLDFSLLAHEFQLPYEDERFDMVISGGVLEHVAFERESMREVWRTLKDDGLFVITFLPNRGSISENLYRLLGHFYGHNRLYSLQRAKESFLRRGFVLEAAGYHQIFPTLGKNVRTQRAAMLVAGLGARLNRPLERVPGVRGLASNLYFVLRKAKYM